MSETVRRKRIRFQLSDKQKETLEEVARSRTEKHSRVMRAKYILDFTSGISIKKISDTYGVHRVTIERTLDKAVFGPIEALDDLKGRGRKGVISDHAKMWMLHIACTNPMELELPYETWSMEKLASYCKEHGPKKGYSSLCNIQKGTVCKLLNKSNIKPFKVKYYLDSTDPDFESKMTQVLLTYKQVQLQLEKQKKEEDSPDPEYFDKSVQSDKEQEWTVVSYDEKPGVQMTETKGDTKYPLSCNGKNTTLSRDYEYIRHGTISILSGIDLLTGHVHMHIRDRHRSCEFIDFLTTLDNYYPPETTIEVILDNHSIHKSKETRAYLEEHSGRFTFIFTPTHGSWLNLIEVFFSKLQRCFLKNMRVKSKEEFIQRMIAYIEELNREPVIFRWKYKMDTIEVETL
ncbi:MAG: IS630 family transposase [Caldisericia bacterium]|nr:IS630 family transposase [Caldisericia bacterium]